MQVIDLLDRTGRSPVTARPEDTLQTAATLLANNNIGAMPVRDGEGQLVGVQTGSNTEELLRSRGFQHGHDFVTYSHYSHGIKMLFNHRFAMMPLTSFVARANTCRNGFDGDKIEPVLRITELSNPLWMVLSRGTAPDLAARFRAALVQLKRQGEDQRLRAAYLEDFERAACAEK